MYLQEIFDSLRYGELSQLAVGGACENGDIDIEDKRKIASHVQLGLTALFARFRLKESRVIIKTHHRQHLYEISYDTLGTADLLHRYTHSTHDRHHPHHTD